MKKIIVVVIFVMLLSCATSEEDVRLKSPNFENGVFKNTQSIEMHSFGDMLWFALTSDIERAIWPEKVIVNEDKSPLARVENTDIRVTFINHATFLIQTEGFNILTDPVFSERTSPFSFVGPKRIHQPGISIEDLPEIDVIIISHDHYDHLDLDSIDTLIVRDNPKVYMGLGVAERLVDKTNVTELDWWQTIQVSENFQLSFVDVQHFSGRTLTDRNSTLWGGFLLNIHDKRIYFGGDSGYGEHYKRTYEHFGPVDLAFLPIGAYAPRQMFKPIHLDPYEAVQAHKDLKAKFSIGMHYGTFQLSAEPFEQPIELLEKAKNDAGISSSSFITLAIGEPLHIPH